jgi:hypothetical protein
VPFGAEIRQRFRLHQQSNSALPADSSSQHFCLQVSSGIHRLVINFFFFFFCGGKKTKFFSFLSDLLAFSQSE